MWTWFASLALASAPAAPPADEPAAQGAPAATDAPADPAPAVGPPAPADPLWLPLQVQDEARWREIDLRATRTARIGGWMGVGGLVGLLGGIGMVAAGEESGSDALTVTGATTAVLGGVSAVVGPPVSLAGAMRANRALREQGVYVSNGAGVAGWTTLGVTSFLYPLFAPAVGAAGWGQIEANRAGRERAGLPPARVRRVEAALVPTGNGAAITGTF